MNDGGPIVEVYEPGRRPLRIVLTGPLVLGRDCDGLLLTDSQISRRHLELRPSASGVEVADLASSNGTFVDGRRVSAPTPVAVGGEVHFGACRVMVLSASAVLPGARREAPLTAADAGRRASISARSRPACPRRSVVPGQARA